MTASNAIRFLKLCAALLVCSVCTDTALGAVKVTAQLDRATAMAGETINFAISVEGGNPQSAESFPPVNGLTIQYRGTSQSITSINGHTTIQHTLNYNVTAPQPGQFTIPAIKVYVDGTAYPTRPPKLPVTKADLAVQNRVIDAELLRYPVSQLTKVVECVPVTGNKTASPILYIC